MLEQTAVGHTASILDIVASGGVSVALIVLVGMFLRSNQRRDEQIRQANADAQAQFERSLRMVVESHTNSLAAFAAQLEKFTSAKVALDQDLVRLFTRLDAMSCIRGSGTGDRST